MKHKYIKSPSEVLAENEIDLAKAKHAGMSNPFVLGLQGLGGMMMNSGMNMMGSAFGGGGTGADAPVEAAYGAEIGGKMPVEVEGEEVVKKANGQSAEVKGPKHEQGGIDVLLGMGDKVFSDRITKDGKTMAEREKARQKNLAKFQKMLEKTPGDSLLKKTLKKTTDNNAQEEAADLAAQAAIRELMETASAPKENVEAAFGFDPTMFTNIINNMQGAGVDLTSLFSGFNGSSDDFHTGDNQRDYNPARTVSTLTAAGKTPGFALPDTSELETYQANKMGAGADEKGGGIKIPDIMGNLTGGDMLGIAGNLYSGIAPMIHTMNTRAKDTPNENHYEGFGEDALKTIEETKDFAKQNNDALKRDIQKGTNSAKRSGRIGARGINTQRAMDLATEQGANDARGNASSAFAEQMIGILGKQGQMENIQDQMVMGGEEARDMRDRADKDNHATQMAQNIVGLGESIQQTGSDLNDVKQNEIIMKMLDQLSKYGLGFDKPYNVTKKK